MQEKTSLHIYRIYKTEIKEENKIYDNTAASVTYFKCRTNTLNLNDRKRFKNENTKCEMCDCQIETLEHFLLYCEGYTNERKQIKELQQPYIENEVEILGNLLYTEEKAEIAKQYIYKIWKIRENKKKEATR